MCDSVVLCPRRNQSVYNSPLPDALGGLVNNFKTYLKQQKETSDQFSKFSGASFKEVDRKISVQNQVMGRVCSSLFPCMM